MAGGRTKDGSDQRRAGAKYGLCPTSASLAVSTVDTRNIIIRSDRAQEETEITHE